MITQTKHSTFAQETGAGVQYETTDHHVSHVKIRKQVNVFLSVSFMGALLQQTVTQSLYVRLGQTTQMGSG